MKKSNTVITIAAAALFAASPIIAHEGHEHQGKEAVGENKQEVTVKGEVNERTGFVVDLKQLKEILESEVVSAMDHRHLNKEVHEFATAVPTVENLAVVIWKRLAPKLKTAKLHRVRVYESDDLFADFLGED